MTRVGCCAVFVMYDPVRSPRLKQNRRGVPFVAKVLDCQSFLVQALGRPRESLCF